MWIDHWEVDEDGDVWVSILLFCVDEEEFVHVPFALLLFLWNMDEALMGWEGLDSILLFICSRLNFEEG